MSAVQVVSDDGATVVDIHRDDEDGSTSAACRACPWTSDPDRWATLHDAIEDAGIHADQQH